LEALDFLRPGANVELDRVLISYVFAAMLMEMARQLSVSPTAVKNSQVNRRHQWPMVLAQIGVLSGLVGLYLLSYWIGIQKSG
jgi:hypothetical protein